MAGWRVEGVSESLDHLMSSVASSFNTLYAPTVEAMLPHLANGPLLEVRAKPPPSPSQLSVSRTSPTAGVATTARVGTEPPGVGVRVMQLLNSTLASTLADWGNARCEH